MTLSRHVLRILAIVMPVFFIGYSLELFRHYSSAVGDYFEISTELLPLVLSFSVFVITWYSYSTSRDNHSLFLGAAFFIIGLLDLYHMLSYPFMPAFITLNSLQKSTFFWVEALLVSALLFNISAYVYQNTLPRLINKSVLFILIILLSFMFLTAGLSYPERMPSLYDAAGSPSATLQFLVIITTAFLLCAAYLYTRRFRKTKKENMLCLIYSFIILFFSYLAYISYGYAGHLLKAAAFYFVYLAIFRSSVVEPFEKLAEDEKRLRRAAEERYRNMVDNANDAIITTDLDGRVISWNRSAEKIFGWTAQEVTGKKLSHLVVPHDKQAENELLTHSIMLGGEVTGIETVHLRKEGSKMDVSMTVSPLYNPSRRIIGLSCIIRDISDRKRAEEIHNENVRLALVMRAKSELLPAISHDLGTPLNAILGFSELLRKGIPGKLNEQQEHYVDNIITSSMRMLDIINDVLDLGRAETGKIGFVIDELHVPDALDEVAGMLKENITKRNVVLKKELDPALEYIEADRQRFRQILFNLLSNAVKYSKPEGGTVTISTKKEGEMAKFSVSDTGIGIKEEDMGKLFKPFEQLQLGLASKYGSTGLGLVVTRKLLELHGGTISAESKYGEGSTFSFTLPLVAKKK